MNKKGFTNKDLLKIITSIAAMILLYLIFKVIITTLKTNFG